MPIHFRASRNSVRAALAASLVMALAGATHAAQPSEQADPAAPAETFKPPVDGVPHWYTISTSPAGPGDLAVRSLTTGRVLGGIAPGSSIMAFGADTRIVTFAYKGQVAYIPLSAATESYPIPPPSPTWHGGGLTLEQTAEKARQRAREARSESLEPKSLRTRAAGQTAPGQPGSPPTMIGAATAAANTVTGGVPAGGGYYSPNR